MDHRQHRNDRDRKNGKREGGAADSKAALIFGHRDVSYGWLEPRGERAESGFVMISRRLSHLQIALQCIRHGRRPGLRLLFGPLHSGESDERRRTSPPCIHRLPSPSFAAAPQDPRCAGLTLFGRQAI